jgi:hypothetical protein
VSATTTYTHGVGRNNAHDKTSGTPVTNFKHSTRLYNIVDEIQPEDSTATKTASPARRHNAYPTHRLPRRH